MSRMDGGERFLEGSWTVYHMEKCKLPYFEEYGYTIRQFIRGFNKFPDHCNLEFIPYPTQDLLCTVVYIELNPEAKRKLLRQTNLKTIKKKSTKTKSTKPDEPQDQVNASEGDQAFVSGFDKVPNLNSKIMLKICLDQSSSLFFCNRQIPEWLRICLEPCLGGDLKFLCKTKCDPRFFRSLRAQKGFDFEGGSLQAAIECDLLEALKDRSLLDLEAPLGAVARSVGAVPENFPIVKEVTITARKLPIPTQVHCVVKGKESEAVRQCQARLAELSLEEITVTINCPSLFHAYYNNSIEKVCYGKNKYRHTEEDDNIPQKKKIDLEGVIRKPPAFMKNLRSKAVMHQILEYR